MEAVLSRIRNNVAWRCSFIFTIFLGLIWIGSASKHWKFSPWSGFKLGDGKVNTTCEFWSGNWVKMKGRPLYSSLSCPYIEKNFDCKAQKKSFDDYEHYGWEPAQCKATPFSSSVFLKSFKNSLILFVGDSFMRQMFQSLLCLLTAGPGSNQDTKAYELTNRTVDLATHLQFIFPRHNVTLEYTSSRFLVESSEKKDHPSLPPDSRRTYWALVDRAGSWIDRAKSASLVVLHTGAWWSDHLMQRKGIRLYYETISGRFQSTGPHDGLQRAIDTISKSLNQDSVLQQIPVIVLAPTVFHFFKPEGQNETILKDIQNQILNSTAIYNDVESPQWNRSGSCTWVDRPLEARSLFPPFDERVKIVEEGFKESVNRAILRVSESLRSRADAHVGLRLDNIMDCSHFCVPGVPDTWNELLFATLVQMNYLPR